MINRQPSSSTQTEISSEKLHAKSIGCMPGIFHLLNNYRNRKNLLTSGKRKETVPKGEENLMRSPNLPAEIRTPPHTVVTRLMGVNFETESAVEKRRKLVGALEKCDEELKAVKRIIEVMRRSISDGGENEIIGTKLLRNPNFTVSSAEEIQKSNTSKIGQGGRIVQSVQKKKKKKKPGEDIVNGCLFDRFRRDGFFAREDVARRKAMVEGVNQVSSDIEWGERREIERLGLALQNHICRDLIDEIVREMVVAYHPIHSLPFDACKRRLNF